jgi:C4-dicarboxylate-specific signal transduction histidine kinase
MVAAGMLSLAHMPEIRGELLELRAALRRQADKGSDLSGPLRSLDGVVARVERLIEALAVLPVTPASTAPLGEVVQAALAARTADLARREVRVLAQIEPGLAVEGEQQRLGAAVGELLRATLPSSREGSLIELAAERSGDEVVLTIADQGAGLPRDVLDRVFDPFMTRSEDWDPLSLDLLEARQALMSHGAMLLIEAKPGRGNTTRIVFRAR